MSPVAARAVVPAAPTLLLAALSASVAVSGATGAAARLHAQSAEPRPMAVEDLFRIATVGSPIVSPGGRYVAYTLSTQSLTENDGTTQIWLIDLHDGSEPRQMSAGNSSAGAPGFSPDGRYLSFLTARDGNEGRQVWIMDLQGGEARPLTQLDRGIGGYQWAPDSRRLGLLLRDAAEDRPESEPRPPWVIDRLQFKQDYSGYLDRRRTHLYVLDLESQELTRLTHGDFDHGSMEWSPDGSRIAFVSNRTPDPDANYDSDVWVVPAGQIGVAASEGDPVPPTRFSAGRGFDTGPTWSPDGTLLAWLTNLRPEIGGYGMSHLAVAGLDSEPRILTEDLDRNVGSLRFSRDGRQLYALLESEGHQSLISIPVAGGQHDVVWGGRRRVEAFEPLPEGGFLAKASTYDAPSELWRVNADGSAHRLTHHNDDVMEELQLARVTKEPVRAPDGTELEAFYTFPSGHGEPPGTGGVAPAPTILWIHGGPMGQDSWGWNGLRQLFAAHGYLVVQPNYRGSHGYGQEFALGLWRDWGGPERIDAVASVDHAIERGWADRDRLGVGGWSYGAITTNAIITRTDRFAAAISGAGAALHVASWGHDQYQRWYTQELGYPWDNHELWDRLSPFFRVADISTPTLWMGGEHDWNVPILQSEIMYQSMKALGRETLLVVYPDQGHGGFPPAYEADRYRRFLGWFGRYLLGDDSAWPER